MAARTVPCSVVPTASVCPIPGLAIACANLASREKPAIYVCRSHTVMSHCKNNDKQIEHVPCS